MSGHAKMPPASHQVSATSLKLTHVHALIRSYFQNPPAGQIVTLASSILVLDTARKFVHSRKAVGAGGGRGMGKSAPLFAAKSVENMV